MLHRVFLPCLLAASCGWSGDLPYRKELPVRVAVELPPGAVNAARIRLQLAELEIVASSDGKATLEGSTEVRVGNETELTMGWRPAALRVGMEGLELAEPAAPADAPLHQLHHRLKLLLPPQLLLDAEVVSGSVKAADRRADVRVQLQNGEAWLDRSHGKAELKVTNGEALVRTHAGPAAAQATNGNAFVDVAAVTGDVRVETVHGNATARVPANAGFAVKASTDTGGLSTDAALDVQRSLLGASAQGKLGDGAHQLTIRTTTGNAVLTLAR